AVAFLFLVGPLQILIFALLARADYWLLFSFAALLPATALELLPLKYAHVVLYTGTLGLLLFLRMTRFVIPKQVPSASGLATVERIPLVILATWIVLAGVNATLRGWGSTDLLYYTVVGLEVLLVTWFFAVVPQSLRQVRALVYAMAATYAVVCCLLPFLASRVVGGFLGKTLETPFAVVNLNVFATHVGVFAVVVIGAFLDSERTLGKLVLSVVFIILLATLLFTKSRGAWLGFGIAFLYILVRTRSFWLLVPAGTAILGLLSLDILRIGVLARVGQTTTQDPSLWGRLLLWKYAWDIFKGNWLFGVGIENFRFVKHFFGFPWPRYFGVAFNTHNIFLEVLVDLGVVGFASFLWLTIGTFLRVDRIVRVPSAKSKGLAIGLNAAIIVYAVHGLMDCVIWQHGAFMLLGVLLGLSMSVHRLGSGLTGAGIAPRLNQLSSAPGH
ncbi:hypothetical protein CH330_08685, partial [candidate division WOR-3 bacterium JGI_Cruoil_03_51_56]